jgi:hypothetical protein
MDSCQRRVAYNTSMVEIEQDADVWDEKNSTDLDGLNTSTSSMEIRHVEITLASKYVNALPRGRWP